MNSVKKKYGFGLSAAGLLLALLAADAAAAEEFPVVVEASVRAVISAERAGILSVLSVDTGDRIRKGEVLGVVAHRNLVLQRQLHEATRDYLKGHVENLARLGSRGLATDEELSRARTDLAVKEKEIAMTAEDIRRSHLYAPFSGLVVMRRVQPHEWVTPGQPALEIYDPKRLQVVADIPSDVAVGLKTDQTHMFFFPDIAAEVEGEIAVFAPQVDVRSNTVKIYWRLAPEAHRETALTPGMKGVLRLDS